MRRLPANLAVAVCATAIFMSASVERPALAADAGVADSNSAPTSSRSESVPLPSKNASIFVPAGWVQVPPQAGAVAVLRAAGDVDAQIEVRTSAPVGAPRQPNYFSTFHARIKRAGFEETDRSKGACVDGQGTEVSYLGRIDGRPFQLIICQWSVSERVWLVSAFYPEPARRFYYPGFQRLLSESRFD
jgi:hypothetical protein